jgi:PAS domain S-box-containing protein
LQEEYKGGNSELALGYYKMAVDLTTILSITDPNGLITYANSKFCEISGYTPTELIGKNHNIVRHPEMPAETFKELWHSVRQKKIWRGIIKNLAKDGSTYIVDATIFPILDEMGEIREIVGIRYDITEQQRQKTNLEANLSMSKDMLIRMKQLDPITGLKNQNALIEFFKNFSGDKFTVVGIKIDNLKSIKDILGSEFADYYICELTEMLIRYTELMKGFLGIYRIYFDEIVIVFTDEHGYYEKFSNEISHIAKYFFTTYGGISINSTFTIALFSGTEDLYAKTLSALLYTFEHFKGEVYIVQNDSKCFEDKFPSNIYWLERYSQAIENSQMVPFYQPLLNNGTGKVDKFECLARINSDDGVIAPDKFINLALSARQISSLTKAIARKAFEHFADKPQFSFSLNASASDIQDDELFKHILYWQNKTQIDPSRCIIEILESEDIYKYRIFRKAIENFKNAGFKIAIDDFGTGYSNFITLYEYQVDFIKIDGSFIKNLDKDPSMYELVSHLNQLIRMCGSKSVAEFVSNEKIFSIVKEIGIDYAQGYHIGVPKVDTIDFE